MLSIFLALLWVHPTFSCLSYSIGCGIGYGYLHRIPVPDTTKPLKPPMGAPAAPMSGFSEVSWMSD